MGDICIYVCGCGSCGCIGDMVVSKVVLVRCSPEVVGVFGGVGVESTAGAVHSSPSVLGMREGECRSEGICACSVHKSWRDGCSGVVIAVLILSMGFFA